MTTIGPEVAPAGTVVRIAVIVLLLLTAAAMPLNVTVSAELVAPKFVPLIVTCAPTHALVGEILEMVGGGGLAVTVKLVELVAVWPLTVTVNAPVVAPEGTVV